MARNFSKLSRTVLHLKYSGCALESYQQCSHSCPHAVAVRREPFDQPDWTIRTEARRFPSSRRHRVWLLSASLTEYLRELLLIERKRIPATDRSTHGFPTAIHRYIHTLGTA